MLSIMGRLKNDRSESLRISVTLPVALGGKYCQEIERAGDESTNFLFCILTFLGFCHSAFDQLELLPYVFHSKSLARDQCQVHSNSEILIEVLAPSQTG